MKNLTATRLGALLLLALPTLALAGDNGATVFDDVVIVDECTAIGPLVSCIYQEEDWHVVSTPSGNRITSVDSYVATSLSLGGTTLYSGESETSRHELVKDGDLHVYNMDATAVLDQGCTVTLTQDVQIVNGNLIRDIRDTEYSPECGL